MEAFQHELIELLPRLRRLARALARDPVDADDLVQVTLERALGRAAQWKAGTSLPNWTFRIMRNAWIDEARARQRKGALFAPEEAGEHVGSDGVAAADARAAARDVESAMATLPDDQRLAVALVLVEGLSYREAAEVMDVPEGTLTSRLVRGRAALAQKLGEHRP